MKRNFNQVLLIAPEIINPRSMPCVALGYIGAYLNRMGVNVRTIDSQFTKEDPIPILRNTPPTIVAISMESRTVWRALKIARIAKSFGHITLIGGLHVSLIKTEIMNHPEVDFGIVGDGEISCFQMVLALKGELDFSEVSGLIYRLKDGQIKMNPNRTELSDLDSLPFPDYRIAGIKEFPLYPLVTSRDCPYRCSFCTVGNISHGRFRARSASDCVDELIAAKEKYNIRGFLIVDENFSFKMDRAIEFCELLIERKVNLPWTVFEGMRADCIDESVLKLLKTAGCRWIFFGIESAENAVLRSVKKGEKMHHIERAVDLSKRFGFKVGGFLIIGLPNSSFEKDMKSLHWALEHLDKSQFWMAIPYFGTTMLNWVRKNGKLLRDPIGDNLVNTLSTMPYFETPDYPARDRKKAHVIASLRTGIDYFFDYLDKEAYNKIRWTKEKENYYRKKLIKTTVKYDKSYLPSLFENRSFPNVEDPILTAIKSSNGINEDQTKRHKDVNTVISNVIKK